MNQDAAVNMPSVDTDVVRPTEETSAQAAFNLQTISAQCSSGSCPTVYDSGRGTIVVQGYTVTGSHAGVALPAGEQLVEIPVELLMNAARNLS
ncbi:hypothetical protein AB0J82_29145 [Asanoa sp. NPDC049518]|uniref:hypothetical protein n=1 Tax=unclassified Asanoa TaxID=2685164 RepID=UPI0034161C00